MSVKKSGSHTMRFQNPPYIIEGYCTVGPKEGQGPLKDYFDEILEDVLFGEDTWEKAESKFMKNTLTKLKDKANIEFSDVDYILTGDLLNQITASCYAIKDANIPFFGLYGACSTMGESLTLGSALIDGGFAKNIIAGTSSHFCSAEKQLRGPLELGSQRPPTSQWTVTGSGLMLVSSSGTSEHPRITHATVGRPVDLGISDVSNMGAAMAPAALDTILTHLRDTGRDSKYYDLIITGDLASIGKEIVIDLARKEGYDLSGNFTDCGVEIFDSKKQGTDSGGSGCGCSATVLNGYLLKKLKSHELNKILFIPTGALMSTLSLQQGDSIIGIAHAVAIENIIE